MNCILNNIYGYPQRIAYSFIILSKIIIMSILNFQKPDKILLQKADDFEGIFEFKPLEPGFGQTIGNSLRRILLSSLEDTLSLPSELLGLTMNFLQ